MKRFLISSVIFPIIFLTSCLSKAEIVPAPTVTLVPSETPSLTPTETPILTEVPLPTEGKIAEIVKSLEGTNYGMKWDKDNTAILLTYTNPENKDEIVEIPEITFDIDGNWRRTYTFETPYGTTAEVSIDSRVDKMAVVEDKDGKKILDFSGWSVKEGKWAKENVNGETTYNVSEAQFMLQNNGSQDLKDGYGIMNESDYDGKGLLYRYLDAAFPGISHVNGRVVINDFSDVIDTGGWRWWGTDIKTLDSSGEPKFIDTTNYVVHNLMSGDAVLIYRDIDRKYRTIIINSNLNDLRNWSPFFKKATI